MEAKREQMVRERMVDLEFKISRLGILGKAYYELAQIKLRRHRNQIRVSRTQNMLLHAALNVLREKGRISRKSAGDLEGLRKTLVAQRITFNTQKQLFFKRQEELAKQITETHSAEIDSQWHLDPNTPILVRIRNLEHRLGLILFRSNDVKMLLRHYEGVLKPMKEEHASYSAKLESVQTIVEMKHASGEKLIQTHHDAIRARDAAKRELEELLAFIGASGRKFHITPELQAKMWKAVGEIKKTMDVRSMRQMYHQYILQEKQTAYLEQIYEELKRTTDQLKDQYTTRRRSSLPKPQLHSMVQETRLMVRRQSERNPSLRRGSIPLFQILDGTKKLVDKLHEGSNMLTEEDTVERNVLMTCEDRLTNILKALNRKLKHVEKAKKANEDYEAMSEHEKRLHDAQIEMREAQHEAREAVHRSRHTF